MHTCAFVCVQQCWVQAEADADLAIELKPDWAKGYSRKGAALTGLGKYAAAVDAYKKGLKLDKNNEQVL